MNNPVHLDLVPLAVELKARGMHPALVKAVERAAAIGSIREDLRTALASLRLIATIQQRNLEQAAVLPADSEEGTVTGALFTQAIILYARATFTSGSRPLLLREDELSPEEAATHAEVKKLRNTTFAHFGRGEAAVDGPLVREAVVRSFDRTQYRYGVYTTRALHKVELGNRLEALINRRLQQVSTRQQKLLNEVEAALNEAARADAALGRALPNYGFDTNAFCKNAEAAKHMQEMLDAGEVEDTDYVTVTTQAEPTR